MKTYYALFVYCLLIASFSSTGLGEQPYHTFTTTDGRTLNAAIKDFNERNGKIKVEREDGRTLWTLPAFFSEEDQHYILQWIEVDQFMTPDRFRINGEAIENRISDEKVQLSYKLSLENKTDFPLNDLRIEHRTFVLTKKPAQNAELNWAGGGQMNIPEIPTGEKVSCRTPPIDIITLASDHNQESIEDHPQGFWIKVYGPEIDGTPVVRDWSIPEEMSAHFTWQDTTGCSPAIQPERPSDEERKLVDKARSLETEDLQKSLEIYHEAYEIAQSPHAASSLGNFLLTRHNPPNIQLGLEWIERAANNNQYNSCTSLAHLYASYNYMEYHDVKKAMTYGLRAIFLKPQDYRGHWTMAKVYAEAGQFDKAVEHQENAVTLYSDTSRNDKESFERQLSRLESDMELFKNKKSVYCRSKAAIASGLKLMESDPEKAITLLTEAYEFSPDWRTALNISRTYMDYLNPPNMPLALEWLDKSTKDGNVVVYRFASRIYSSYDGHTESYNLDKTLEYALKTLSIVPDCYTSHLHIARAYAIDGQFDKAVEHQTQAIQLSGQPEGTQSEVFIKWEATLERYMNKKL